MKPHTESASAQALAEHAAVERLLNSYLRETGARAPRLGAEALAAVPAEVVAALGSEGTPMRVELPRTGGALLGALAYASASGHHGYGRRFWYLPPAGARGEPVESALRLAELVVGEVAAQEPEEGLRTRRLRELLGHIHNSMARTALYVSHAMAWGAEALEVEAAGALLAAEQRVLFGHPFHPTPKSMEGFTPEDLERFAPELGASFALHYLAVAPELVREDFLPGARGEVLPAQVQAEAESRLEPSQRGWPLLPCHPWQADRLRRSSGYQVLRAEGRVVELGPLGAPAHPTSSVRTVLPAGHSHFFKLPLGVRITNLVRNNPPEQLERSLAVSRVAAALQAEAPLEGLTLLLEVGWRALAPPEWSAEARQALAADTAVLFRQARPCGGARQPVVVAALLEPALPGAEPLLVQVLRRAGRSASGPLESGVVCAWLRRYLELSLVPLLRLFVHHGLSLEAHVQNSLLALSEGWPAHCFVRDMEGASLSRERARRHGLPEHSPALYSEAEAWERLRYYFFTNHLAHLLAVLGRSAGVPEQRLWGVVRSVLEAEAEPLRAAGGGRCVEELLEGPSLPAKANLLSRFQERGERPLYLSIPNPLLKEEVLPWS